MAQYDVAIVGSGSLGMAAARRLAENGASVAIFEQGAAISDPPAAHMRNAKRFRQAPDSYLPEAEKHLELIDHTAPRDRPRWTRRSPGWRSSGTASAKADRKPACNRARARLKARPSTGYSAAW